MKGSQLSFMQTIQYTVAEGSMHDKKLLAVFIGLTLVPLVHAEEFFGWATDPFSGAMGLYRTDTTTLQTVYVGAGKPEMRGLAIMANGAMYASDSAGFFYSVNPFTAETTKLGQTVEDKGINALDSSQSPVFGEELWAVEDVDDPQFHALELERGGPVKVKKPGGAYGPVRAMAWDKSNPNGTVLAGIADRPQVQTGWFFAPDPEQSAMAGAVDQRLGLVRGMDFDGLGDLYAVTDKGGLLRLDPFTLEVVQGMPATHLQWYDISFGVVPEPSMILVTAGSLILALRRRRRPA